MTRSGIEGDSAGTRQRLVTLAVRCRRNDESEGNKRVWECGMGPRG